MIKEKSYTFRRISKCGDTLKILDRLKISRDDHFQSLKGEQTI